MLESISGKQFEYKKLTLEEQKSRGILGRLVGVIADAKQPTRNGRLYSEELWDKTFEDPIMKEKIQNKCCFGELGHPENRSEVDMEKIAICLDDFPKKRSDGKLVGVFNILDTPNGRILKTLCDYGCSIGVSSRGNGDVIDDYDGTPFVDPDTYECECWDAVLIPAVQAARPQYVTESLDTKSLKKALAESISKENADSQRIITETLDKLKIDYKPETVSDKVDSENTISASNAGVSIMKDLQEALSVNKEREQKVIELQEKLSACNAREEALKEELSRYKSSIITLSNAAKSVKALNSKVNKLTEQLTEKSKVITTQSEEIESLKRNLTEGVQKNQSAMNSLDENVKTVKWLKSLNSKLTENLESNRKKSQLELDKLQESVATLKKDSAIVKQEYTKKLNEAISQVSKYKGIASTAVNKYIESRALSLGVTSNDIKSKLNENYSFDDIDDVCNGLQEYQLNISKLPFNIERKGKVKIKVSESYEPLTANPGYDDEVDSSLLELAKLN